MDLQVVASGDSAPVTTAPVAVLVTATDRMVLPSSACTTIGVLGLTAGPPEGVMRTTTGVRGTTPAAADDGPDGAAPAERIATTSTRPNAPARARISVSAHHHLALPARPAQLLSTFPTLPLHHLSHSSNNRDWRG